MSTEPTAELKKEALALTKKARELNLTIQRSSLALGKIYKRMVDGKLWEPAGHPTLDAWLSAVGDIKRSQMYAVLDIYRELEAAVPEEIIEKMPLNNARDLLRIPEAKRTKEVQAAACELNNRTFRDYVEAQVQPGLKLDENDHKSFGLSKAAKEKIDEILSEVMKRQGYKTEAEALEFIFDQYGDESSGRQRTSASLVCDAVEQAIVDSENIAMPPDPLSWGKILAAVEYMQKVFGFKKKEVTVPKPKVARAPVTARLQ